MKACINCKHFDQEGHYCGHIENNPPSEDVVYGEKRYPYTTARTARIDEKLCGSDGRLYEERKEMKVWPAIVFIILFSLLIVYINS